MNRFTKKITADLWLNLVIIVLLIALFFQCALYLSEYAHRNGDSGDVPFEMQMLSTSSTGSLRGIDGSMLSPSLVAVSSEGKASAVMNSAAVMDEIYTEIGHCLFDALAKEAISVSEEDWRMAAREDSFVYVLYPSEMPYQVVFAFAAAKEASDQTLRRADGYVGIREILLIPDASGDLTHMLVRGREGVFAYTLGNTVPMSVFADYSLLYPDIFYRGCFHVREYETEFVIDEKISSRVIYASEGSAALLRSNNDHMDVLFRLLNFNPDKLRYHTEEDGANVYVESHGILRIDSRSIVYTSAEQGGIQLSKVIGQGVKGDIYTYLQTASYIIRRLSSMDVQYTGGDAKLYLKSVSVSGEHITLEFAYYSDNVEIYADSKHVGFTFTFTGDTISRIVYDTVVVRRSLSEQHLMQQNWCKKQMVGENPAYMHLVYRLDENDIALSAEWMAAKEGGRR